MGVTLDLYIPDINADPPEPLGPGGRIDRWDDGDIWRDTRLCLGIKRYEMYSEITNRPEWRDDLPYHLKGREMAWGFIPAGALAEVMGRHIKPGTFDDDVAALSYIASLPGDRVVVIVRT